RTVADAERMFRETGYHGIAIGRGALLNPWIFAQLQRWDETGDPGLGPTYAQRLEFMDRHFRLLVQYRGEHFASLVFRKVGNWYCRVLKPGREVQQTLMMLDSLATFERVVDGLRRHDAYHSGEEWLTAGLAIQVPSGPIEHW